MAENTKINIGIDKDLLEKVDVKAEELHISRSALFRLAIIEYLKINEKNKE